MIREIKNEKCVGCGYCCIKLRCTYGRYRYADCNGLKCPGLKWTGKRYVCELAVLEDSMGEFYRKQLKVGQGCRSYCNPWRKDVRERTEAEMRELRSS